MKRQKDIVGEIQNDRGREKEAHFEIISIVYLIFSLGFLFPIIFWNKYYLCHINILKNKWMANGGRGGELSNWISAW